LYPQERIDKDVIKNQIISWCKQNNRKYGNIESILYMTAFTANPKEGQTDWDSIEEQQRQREHQTSIDTIELMRKLNIFTKIQNSEYVKQVIKTIDNFQSDKHNELGDDKRFEYNLHMLKRTFLDIQEYNLSL